MPLNRRTYEFIAIALAVVLLSVMAFLFAGSNGVRLASGQPVFGDFIAFWSAGRAALDGLAAHVHEPNVIRHYNQEAVPGVAFFAPWNSPPTFLLIAAPLAMLPYPLAALAFLAGSLAVYAFAALKLLPDKRALIFALTAPAVVYHVGSVQTGLLFAGVTALALLWVDKHPIRAGVLIALLAIKPHLAILWPVFLAVSQRWRVFGIAAAATFVFCLLAALLFGRETFGLFFESLRASTDLITDQRISTPAYASVYASLRGYGVPDGVAIVIHAISALAALAGACWLFVREGRAKQGAALCAVTMLFSPYIFFYDSTLLLAGAALLGLPRGRFETAAYVLVWGAGLSLAIGYVTPFPLCPLAAWLLLIVALRREGSVQRATLA